MLCQETTKAGNPCPYKAKYIFEEKNLCGIHLKTCQKQSENATEPKSIPKPEPKAKAAKAEAKPKAEPKAKAAKAEAKPKAEPKPKAAKISKEEKELVTLVDKFLQMKLDPNELKKQGRCILLKIHPDKCRFDNVDAHALTQKVLLHMRS